MSKPTDEELESALQMAAQMRDKKLDPFFIAKTLLNHNYRLKYLEEIFIATDRYLNHGMSEQERTRLLRLMEKVKDKESNTAGQDRPEFGL